MDFARKEKAPDIGEALTALIDKVIVDRRNAEYAAGRGSGLGEVAQKRIGAGYIGTECDRALAYRYHRVEKETREEYVSAGELQRHALVGFWTEESMAEWLRLAGFDLRTNKEDGSQYGYRVARDPTTGQARIAGEIDGCILAGPLAMPYPLLWESKKATAKKFAKFAKEGVAKADPKYHGQIQTNMAYLEVEHTLFTMLNVDSMKIYQEIVRFDPAVAQRLTDRAVRVLESRAPEEMPRIAGDESDWRCKFCDYRARCWDEPSAPEQMAKPAWLTGGGA
ncbi:MAG: hypothetical protein A3E78_11980 [Alphaproteobacteria bacterium RIFCSPHIGHO2_12_FULL_63_12]|nr:MAG: hypothetical protein A3E78_11980 [Alphaproteobacteria bacterium RIFCSPHIGHO2_12_FULL_63_12]